MRPVHLCLVALSASAVLLAPMAAHAKASGFEGRIALRLQDVTPQGADYSIRGDRVSIDLPTLARGHQLRVVFDSAHLPAAGAAAGAMSIERTGEHRLVVGQLCEEWVLRGAGEAVHACVVPGVAWVDPRRAIAGDVPAWSQRLEKEHAFPVSVTEGAHFSWATDVARGRVPDSAFVTPPATRAR